MQTHKTYLDAIQAGPKEVQGGSLFIPQERHGLLEPIVWQAIHDSRKKGRASAMSSISTVLKRLRLISGNLNVLAVSFGCLNTGDRGMFVSVVSPLKVEADLPNSGAKYAAERDAKPEHPSFGADNT